MFRLTLPAQPSTLTSALEGWPGWLASTDPLAFGIPVGLDQWEASARDIKGWRRERWGYLTSPSFPVGPGFGNDPVPVPRPRLLSGGLFLHLQLLSPSGNFSLAMLTSSALWWGTLQAILPVSGYFTRLISSLELCWRFCKWPLVTLSSILPVEWAFSLLRGPWTNASAVVDNWVSGVRGSIPSLVRELSKYSASLKLHRLTDKINT